MCRDGDVRNGQYPCLQEQDSRPDTTPQSLLRARESDGMRAASFFEEEADDVCVGVRQIQACYIP